MYDYILTKPDIDSLEHYGIKGMRWRRKKGRKMSQEQKRKYAASKIADDMYNGRINRILDPSADRVSNYLMNPSWDTFKAMKFSDIKKVISYSKNLSRYSDVNVLSWQMRDLINSNLASNREHTKNDNKNKAKKKVRNIIDKITNN